MPFSMFRKTSLVGLDIGHNKIGAVQLERSGRVWRVARAASVPTPPESVMDGSVVDVPKVSEAIKEVLKVGRIGANSAVVGVSGNQVIVRTVQVAKMPDAQLRKSIRLDTPVLSYELH